MLKQLKYFISIVDTHSFTEAAEENYISQSAISQQIKNLEKDLGVQLIIRKNRDFSLTPAGEYFYHHGKSLLEDAYNLRQETIRIGEDNELVLRIGYPKNYSALELQQAIMKFSTIYPEIKISIVTGTHEELFHLLTQHQIDMKLSEQRRMFNDDYVNYELKYSDCFVEIASSHSLAKKEKLTSKDLKNESCILVTSKEYEKSEYDFFHSTLKLSQKFLYADTLVQARMMVLSNQGFLPVDAIGTLPEPMTGITRIPLYSKGKQLQRNYFACWEKENANYYIEEFAEMLRQLLN